MKAKLNTTGVCVASPESSNGVSTKWRKSITKYNSVTASPESSS
jgi:hypothetical protein